MAALGSPCAALDGVFGSLCTDFGFGLFIGLGLAIGIILLQQHFSFIMITPTMPYPVLFEWQNMLIVIMTIVILGLISSWIASGTVNKKLFS